MKVFNYIIILTGIILLLQMAGIPTGAQGVFNLVGLGTSEASVSASPLFDAIFGSVGILIGIITGIAIGIFTRASPENFIILPLITGSLALFVTSFVTIMNYSLAIHPTWISAIIVLILGPLTVGFILSLVEFFRGTD